MKYPTPTLIVLVLILLFSGCEKDLNIDLPFKEDPELNIYGFVYADRPTLLMISKTKPYNTGHKIGSDGTRVEAATIRYFINDELVETTKLQPEVPNSYSHQESYKLFVMSRIDLYSSAHLWYKSSTQPRPGDKVRIEVDSPGLPTAFFEGKLPPTPVITDVRVGEILLSETTDPLGLISRKKNYESEKSTIEWSEGLTPETSPIPPFSTLVSTQKGKTLSFNIQGTGKEQYYTLGTMPSLHLTYSPSIGVRPGIEERSKNMVALLLYDLSRVIDTGAAPVFSVRAKEIAHARVNSGDRPTMFQPYFTTGENSQTYHVSCMVPLIHADASEYGVQQAHQVVLSALSIEYGHFAESGYGIYKGQSSIPDLDLSGMMAEHAMERSNLRQARGIIYLATPLSISIR